MEFHFLVVVDLIVDDHDSFHRFKTGNRGIMIRTKRFMVLLTVFVTSMAFSGPVAAQSTPTIRVKYLSESEQPFASLSTGSVGIGFILNVKTSEEGK
jgi:hypothetical protein